MGFHTPLQSGLEPRTWFDDDKAVAWKREGHAGQGVPEMYQVAVAIACLWPGFWVMSGTSEWDQFDNLTQARKEGVCKRIYTNILGIYGTAQFKETL